MSETIVIKMHGETVKLYYEYLNLLLCYTLTIGY